MTLQEINFWKRLENFISNVQVNDMPSEEEKEMILNVCKREKANFISSKQDVIKSVCHCKTEKEWQECFEGRKCDNCGDIIRQTVL